MIPMVDFGALKKCTAWEYALRFVFGGLVTGCTGLVAEKFGPLWGGVFLAFPAILPASLTLVKKLDGRAKSADEARGGRLGTLGLATFAIVVTSTATRSPFALSLSIAAVAWFIVNAGAWWLLHRRET